MNALDKGFNVYFILKNNILMDVEYSLKEPEGLAMELSLLTGSPVTYPALEPLVFKTTATKDNVMIDFKDCSFPLMSRRFITLLQEAGVDNLQILPAVIESETDGTVWDQYVAVNVLGAIACADLAKSTYSELMPGSYMFDELAIKADKAKGSLLFRLQEDKATMIIHKSVGKYLKDSDPDKSLLGWTVGRIIQ